MTVSVTPRDERDDPFDGVLARARGGCGESLGDLLQGCRRYLLLTAARALDSNLRPKEGASDLVQRTFVIAQRDFQSFRGSTAGELLGWLQRILARQLSRQVRYYKRTSKRTVRRQVSLDENFLNSSLVADQGPGPAEALVTVDEKRRIRKAIEHLPGDYQEVLRLRTWQRLPFAEVARQMNRSPAAAEKLWMRAVERLQAVLRMIS